MTNITNLTEWHTLETHQKHIAKQHMKDWFEKDASRFSRFSLQAGGILLDYSKNRIIQETIHSLCQLAQAVDLPQKIAGLFNGQPINTTEKRPALHTALRSKPTDSLNIEGNNIIPAIHAALDKMRLFTEQVRNQTWRGATNKPIRDVVNIGIGGSHLGPLMAVRALSDFATDTLRCHFISNLDHAHINDVLNQLDPETTLFIISSKSFSTLETITNARVIRTWLQNKLGSEKNIAPHFVAVTAAPELAIQFGIPANQIFPIWDWVGGRYSIWSAIGLPLALAIGMDKFLEFLAGAHAMDEHFRHAEFSENMPVLMALLGIWYINFFGANTHAVVPYAHHLNYFRAHLQQLDMESNGKSVTLQGSAIDYATGPVLWGEQGCNGQHSFHQLLHQGQHFIPVDFILTGQQDLLVASGLSQSLALMQGKSYEQALAELITSGLSQKEAEILAVHKTIPGNHPSNTLFIDKITPYTLGSLTALYEHKIFVQGAIWNINSFDQWGVELGKQLLPKILADFKNTSPDPSTRGLIEYYLRSKS